VETAWQEADPGCSGNAAAVDFEFEFIAGGLRRPFDRGDVRGGAAEKDEARHRRIRWLVVRADGGVGDSCRQSTQHGVAGTYGIFDTLTISAGS
jgi:hypothetical protein